MQLVTYIGHILGPVLFENQKKEFLTMLFIVKPTDWHFESNSETKMTWNLCTISPAANKRFCIQSIFVFCLLTGFFVCLLTSQEKEGRHFAQPGRSPVLHHCRRPGQNSSSQIYHGKTTHSKAITSVSLRAHILVYRPNSCVLSCISFQVHRVLNKNKDLL